MSREQTPEFLRLQLQLFKTQKRQLEEQVAEGKTVPPGKLATVSTQIRIAEKRLWEVNTLQELRMIQ